MIAFAEIVEGHAGSFSGNAKADFVNFTVKDDFISGNFGFVRSGPGELDALLVDRCFRFNRKFRCFVVRNICCKGFCGVLGAFAVSIGDGHRDEDRIGARCRNVGQRELKTVGGQSKCFSVCIGCRKAVSVIAFAAGNIVFDCEGVAAFALGNAGDSTGHRIVNIAGNVHGNIAVAEHNVINIAAQNNLIVCNRRTVDHHVFNISCTIKDGDRCIGGQFHVVDGQCLSTQLVGCNIAPVKGDCSIGGDIAVNGQCGICAEDHAVSKDNIACDCCVDRAFAGNGEGSVICESSGYSDIGICDRNGTTVCDRLGTQCTAIRHREGSVSCEGSSNNEF